MAGEPTFVVNTFTQSMSGGNPTGVVVLDHPAAAHWMQQIATEFNYPATAFVGAPNGGGASRCLRWFSPTAELALCGSGTLAGAHVLGGDQTFQTRDRLLTSSVEKDGAVSIRFPADPVRPEPPTSDLVAGLPGITVRSVWRGRMDLLVEAASAAEVRALQPDTRALTKVDARTVIVTAAGDGGADIVSRVFAPRFGIAEDPVTGSAHCALADLWLQRLDRDELLAEQASPRGGMLRVRPDGDHVVLTGHAVTVLSGELRV